MAGSPTQTSAGSLPVLKPKEMIDLWEVVRELGSGTFGAVYEVYNTKTKCKEAMKVEKRDQDEASRTLKIEISVLMELNEASARNVCTLTGTGRKEKFCYMVMTLVGPSFENILKRLAKASGKKADEGKMSCYSALHCAKCSLQALEDMHRASYVHRDVKPQNFAIGLACDTKSVYLIDFGTARKYLRFNGQHHRPRARCGFRGTTLYASTYALRGEEQSRRDDIWSWIYILIRLTSGTLPWMSIKPSNDYYTQLEQYATAKDAAIANIGHLLKGCPPSYKDILETMKSLTYYSSPDYMVIYNILKCTMQTYLSDGTPPPLDWDNEKNMDTAHPSSAR